MKHNPIQHRAQQGTKEWANARAGCITASCFDRLLTAANLKPSKSMAPYLCQLAGEAVLGWPMETYQSAAMDRGQELEPRAREAFTFFSGFDVEEAGLVYLNADRRIACSPDGLLYEDPSGLELKCPGMAKHVEYLLGGVCPAEYWHQVQGCMYVTNRPRWWFMSYFPGLPPFITLVEPDERYFAAIDRVLPEAVAKLDEMIEKVRAAQ